MVKKIFPGSQTDISIWIQKYFLAVKQLFSHGFRNISWQSNRYFATDTEIFLSSQTDISNRSNIFPISQRNISIQIKKYSRIVKEIFPYENIKVPSKKEETNLEPFIHNIEIFQIIFFFIC